MKVHLESFENNKIYCSFSNKNGKLSISELFSRVDQDAY